MFTALLVIWLTCKDLQLSSCDYFPALSCFISSERIMSELPEGKELLSHGITSIINAAS